MNHRSHFTFTGLVCVFFFVATVCLTAGLPQSARAEEPYELTISTIPAGFASYIMGVALAEQINKHSTWLKATAMEGRGPAEHMKLLVKKPAKRKNYLFFNSTWDIWEAKKQLVPYKGIPFNYDDFRFVTLIGIAGNGLCTLDPEIKSVKDLEGKRVIFDSGKGKGREMAYTGVLKTAGVSIDKIKQQYSSGKAAADTLRDGLVDVIYTGHILKKLPNVYGNSPFQAELVATKKTFFISFEEKDVLAFKKNTGHPLAMVKIPPKMLGPEQTQPCGVLIKPLGFAAHISMPDKVVTEIVRIVYENAEIFKDYTFMGNILTKKTMASLSVPEQSYHPAAVKFYKEKGVPITGFDQ